MDTGSFEQLRSHERPVGDAEGDQLLRLAAIGLMTPSITHDVNNMLQSVGSVLRMIDRRVAHGSPEELAMLTADGLQAIDRATTLSKRLMAFSRPGASTQSRLEVNALLRDLKPLLRWALGPGVAVDMSLDDHDLDTWCDPLGLENAVMNLAVNARDAMPHGGVFSLRTLRAELSLDLPGLLSGDYVVIAAGDTGAGMTPEIVARAFDPYFTTRGAGLGFGMGLASVKAFVDASGGVADILSRPGMGAIVRLYLPLARTRPRTE
jgi:signal transduction histidine kinase